MKKVCSLMISILATVAVGSASSLALTGSDSEFGLFDNVSYTLSTIGNSGIGNTSGFTPASGQSTLATATGVAYLNYLALLPTGATITGATLDLSGLFTGETDSSSLTGGSFFYQPAFSSSLGAYSVKITATLASTTLSGSSAVGYNLWALFQNDILAGNTITVQWLAPDTFTANNSTYTTNCKNCSEQFNVKDTANFTATTASNELMLTYAGAAVPEPSTLSTVALALIGLGAMIAFKRTRCALVRIRR